MAAASTIPPGYYQRVHISKICQTFFWTVSHHQEAGTRGLRARLATGCMDPPSFHISKMKPFHGVQPSQIPPLAPSITSTRINLQPIKVLDSRVLQNSQGSRKQLLIQWEGLSDLETTWEDAKEFSGTYPNIALEDKVKVDPGSNVTSPQAEPGEVIWPPPLDEPSITPPKRIKKPPNWLSDFI